MAEWEMIVNEISGDAPVPIVVHDAPDWIESSCLVIDGLPFHPDWEVDDFPGI